jgi:hypothetical protein
MDAPKTKKSPRRGKDEVAVLRKRLEEQERTIAALERRVAELEEGNRKRDDTCFALDDVKQLYACLGPTQVSDLIGCLDDCVCDPEELRKRVRDAREEIGH